MFALYSADACISEFIPDVDIFTLSIADEEKLFDKVAAISLSL